MVSVLLLRNYFLEKKLTTVCTRFHQQTGGTLIISEKKFDGFQSVLLKKIYVISPLNDTVLKTDSVAVGISLFKLIQFKSPINRIDVENVNLNLLKTDSATNYDFILRRKNKQPEKELPSSKRNYASQLSALWDNLMDLSSRKLFANNIALHYTSGNYSKFIKIPLLLADKGQMNFTVEDHSGYVMNSWRVDAALNNASNGASFKIVSHNKSPNKWFPFFDRDNKPKIACKFFSFNIEKGLEDDNSFGFNFTSKTDSLSFDYWRIADGVVTFKSLEQNFKITVGTESFLIDSASCFVINKIKVKTFVSFDRHVSDKLNLALSFTIPSQDFFESLPTSMFNLFDGIKTKGELMQRLQFSLDMNNVDALIFDSQFKGKGFSVLKYGKEYFARISNSFMYDAYDKDRYMRSFFVGPENASFTSLNDISHYLQYAVLTSEDPSFFFHNGFIEDAFRESIIQNIKAKRFVRGGSTISMQLVKNVFLSREKTVSRKLQEALIVWLIESHRLVSKERMFEIYLNVIEWGPNIYGIKEAAHFYFNKTPAQLTLAESIYLASIIPHPKYFKYSFDKEGNLKPFLSGYYRLLSNRMLYKTWITPMDTMGLQPIVQLKGEALKFVVPVDTIPNDSLIVEPEDFLN